MFRADFLPFTSKIVEHSRYLPRSEHEMDHVPANLQLSKTVNRFQSHILRLGPVDFHPSNQISILQCKNRQPFSEFTIKMIMSKRW